MNKIEGQVDRGLGRLPDKLKRKPLVVEFARAILSEVQELSDAFYDLWFYRSLANAFGDGLDQWGKRLVLKRNGLDDDSYRVRLVVRWLVIKSSGTVPQLIKIFQLLAPAPKAVEYTPRWPAAQELQVTGATLNGDELADILQSAAAGGVQSTFRWSIVDPALTFCLQGGPGLGLSSLANPTIGGRLSRAKG